MKSVKPSPSIVRNIIYTIVFALIWLVLSNGELESWWIGIPAIVICVGVSMLLPTPWPWRWQVIGVIRFTPFFLGESFRSGVEVAYRALHPDMPLDPVLLYYPLRLPEGLARISFANAISLLPGTLSAELAENHIVIHALDGSKEIVPKLELLELRIADFFGLDISNSQEKNHV